MSSGWLKLHRELMDKPIWFQSTLEQKVILITLLMMVAHEEKQYYLNGEKVLLMPGQIGTSLEKITEAANKQVSVQNVRTALKKFERLGFLTDQSTKSGRLISIVNWGFYQGNTALANKDANSCLTDAQQTANRRLTDDLTPIKKERTKELKNERIKEKDKEIGHSPAPARHKYGNYQNVLLSDEDLVKLQNEFASDWQQRIERLSEYMESTGKKYKSHLATIRSWSRNEKQKQGQAETPMFSPEIMAGLARERGFDD